MIAAIKNNINMIIVDECHQVLSSSHFCSAFHAVERLYEVAVPRLFLTATLPTTLQNRFLETVKVDQSSCQVIRSKRTQRANLGWGLLTKEDGKWATYDNLFSLAHKMQKELKKKSSDCGIIFVHNRMDVEQIVRMHLLKHKSSWLGE
jgi:superfamily II DNA helicase RecQ